MAGMMKSRAIFGVILAVGFSIGFCGRLGAQTTTTAPSVDQPPARNLRMFPRPSSCLMGG